MSLFDDYFGLSNRGFHNRALYNAGLSLKCYKSLKQTALDEFKAETDEAIERGLVIAHGDNFNQQFWVSRVDANRDLLTNANRCVGGLSIIPKQIDLAALDRNLQSIPKDPEQLREYLPQVFSQTKISLKIHGLRKPEAGEWFYFDKAEVTQNAIYCVPLKLPNTEKKRRELPDHHIGLKYWRPGFVADMNPGSNEGCYAMLHKIYEQLELAYNRGHYLIMRADLNIYNMFLKVKSAPL